MTGEQKEKVKQMRQQGIGYKQIANEIGLSRDSVRGYCRRHGLDGFGEELAMKRKMLLQEEFLYVLCLQCGKEIKQNATGRKRKYCCMECKRIWDKTHHKSYNLKCSYCGKEFKSLGIKHLKYCCRDCYIKDRFWRKEDAKEIADKILEFKKVNKLPKWLKELLVGDEEV
ncbi:RNA polymerase subunit sigma-24 [Clostridium ihumii]|uniref:RNA polymerase subunit sigma-24 n=1 Tax=Clostridium ihumii TaxID=1470356 RepID=UPI00054E0E4F|nr:RNA polymerase subunit sigma-24 [Clostridium ihumii]